MKVGLPLAKSGLEIVVAIFVESEFARNVWSGEPLITLDLPARSETPPCLAKFFINASRFRRGDLPLERLYSSVKSPDLRFENHKEILSALEDSLPLKNYGKIVAIVTTEIVSAFGMCLALGLFGQAIKKKCVARPYFLGRCDLREL